MDTSSDGKYFDLLFLVLVGIRFHPRNIELDSADSDVMSRELNFCATVALDALRLRNSYHS